MIRTLDIDSKPEELCASLSRAIQSARLNFLIGAGCSLPALAALGDVEYQVQELYENDKIDEAELLIFRFLEPFLNVSCKMIDGEIDASIGGTLQNG